MTISQSDKELIGAIALEINDRIKTIEKLIPIKVDDKIFFHLASCSIHFAMFLLDVSGGKADDESVKKFMATCGCNNK